MELFYLLVCVAGLTEFKIPDICQVYTLEPQYEMTTSEIASAVIKVCEASAEAAIAHGGRVTKCEISQEFPEGLQLNQLEPFSG